MAAPRRHGLTAGGRAVLRAVAKEDRLGARDDAERAAITAIDGTSGAADAGQKDAAS
jgi:hypothetical protein